MKYNIVSKEINVYDVIYTLRNGEEIIGTVTDIYVDAKGLVPEEFKSAFIVAFVRYQGKQYLVDKRGVHHIITNNPVLSHRLVFVGTKRVQVRTLAVAELTWWQKVKQKLGIQ